MRLILLCLAITLSGRCFADDCVPEALAKTYDDDWKPTGSIPWRAEYADAPSWNIDQGEPPLSISAAIKEALVWAKHQTDRTDIEILSAALQPTGCKNKWVYWVYFKPASGAKDLGPHMAIVLMDGSVVDGAVRASSGRAQR